MTAAVAIGASLQAVGTVYAIANQKGGVGKTTTAVNVARVHRRGRIRDAAGRRRPAGERDRRAGHPAHAAPGLYEVLTGEATAAEALTDSAFPGLRVLPAGAGSGGRERRAARASRASSSACASAWRRCRDRFEYILLDCPPSLGPLTVSALVAADRVIVPVQTEYFALEGLAGLLETLALVQRELNPRLTVAGMLLTMHDSRTRLGRTWSARCASTSRTWCSTR